MAAPDSAPRFITVRSRPLSLWQSAVREGTQDLEKSDPALAKLMRYAAGLHAEATVKGQPIPQPPPPPPGAPLSLEHHMALSKAHFDLVRARKVGDAAGELAAKAVIRDYSNWDVSGWATCEVVFAAWYGAAGKPPVYRDWAGQGNGLSYSVIPYQLPSNAKILLLGDWGTGMTDAVAMLRAGVSQFKPDAIIHLGDVYYSGMPGECSSHIGDVIRSLRSTYNLPLPFFTIPGNHDYYSGGQGFYDTIDNVNVNAPGCQQDASYFCLRSADGNWQFLAMDTGFDDHDPTDDAVSALTRGPNLHPTELVWHFDKLDNFAGSTVLLSHHQLYSAFAEINGNSAWGPAFLNANLYNGFLPKVGKVAAWFWGHEHNFAQYPDQLGFPNCRLLGCSAYEAAKRDDPYDQKYKQIKYGPIPPSTTTYQVGLSPHTTAERTFYNHMFAILTLGTSPSTQQPCITADYYQYPSWDQAYTGTQPSAASALCSETINPASASTLEVGGRLNQVMINGSPVQANTSSQQIGLTLARYQDWFIIGFLSSSSTISYIFGDAAGWNGNRTLPVLAKASDESTTTYQGAGSPPAFSLGPNNTLYCVYATQSGSLFWGSAVPDNNHLFWYPPQPAAIKHADGQTSTPSLRQYIAPALATGDKNEVLFAVYCPPSDIGGGNYAINYACLTYDSDQPSWIGDETIGMIDSIELQPSTCFSPAALVVGNVLYIAYGSVQPSGTYLYLIWGVPDATNRIAVWGGSQASVNGRDVKLNGAPSIALLGGRIVVTYAGGNNNGLASQCNFDPQTGTWAGDTVLDLPTYVGGQRILMGGFASYGFGEALMLAVEPLSWLGYHEICFATIANVA